MLLQTVKIKRNYTTYLFQQLVLKINTSVIFAIRHLNFLHQKSVHVTIAIIPFSEIQETTHKENKAVSEKKVALIVTIITFVVLDSSVTK